MLVAPAFHERILPSRVLLIIASSDEETMAASRVDSTSRSRLAVRSITAPANCKLLGSSVIGVVVIWTVPHSFRNDGRYLFRADQAAARGAARHATQEVIGNIAALLASRNPGGHP